jgi:hypothetical protein
MHVFRGWSRDTQQWGLSTWTLAACAACAVLTATVSRADQPTFAFDVMAVLSKAGCNMGACHGNLNGKGGFRLSLRGEDPAFDFAALTRDLASRRINRMAPEQSLMLLKPSGRLAHVGGVRFREDDGEYAILHDWIAGGANGPNPGEAALASLEVEPQRHMVPAPEDAVQLRVTAVMSNGRRRDVTSMAVYEPSNLVATIDRHGLVRRNEVQFGETTILVRFLHLQTPVRLAFLPERPGFQWTDPQPFNRIDELNFGKLKSLRVLPSVLGDDATFVRRVYLDVLGLLPTADEARAFVADANPHKREALIDRLLARPEFAELWALKWSDVLRNEEKVLDPNGVDLFHAWIKESIYLNKPLDQFARELVSARGSTYQHPPANYYRANRDPYTRAETTARLFLGVRLQCARCHNHPFDRWTQDDYYSWAAIFSRVDYEIIENERRDKLDLNEFNGEQVVIVKNDGDVKNPRTGDVAPPKLLGGPALELGKDEDRLPPLAEWLTSPENRLFAKSQVNFIWYHLLGRGLVEPIDDFRTTNPPSNPELLEWLTDEFIAGGFDLKRLVRTIVASRTYQLASTPNETNAADEANFARANIVRLPAEKLLDAQSQVLDSFPEFAGYPPGTRAGQLAGVKRSSGRGRGRTASGGDRFLAMFGKPERLLACECERSNETTLNQVFLFLSSEELDGRITQAGNRLERLVRSERSDEEVIDELFWTALTRPPSERELRAALEQLSRAGDRPAAVQDLAWALLNAKEFVFRH